MKTNRIKRRESRETAFLLIFEWGFREEESLGDIIAQAEAGRGAVVDEFAHELADKTIRNRALLDETIGRYSSKWKLNRIPRVTLAVLRMSFCELSLFDDIPVGATINEAVELTKKFASEEDAAYLNGILGQFERDRAGAGQDETGGAGPAADAETGKTAEAAGQSAAEASIPEAETEEAD